MKSTGAKAEQKNTTGKKGGKKLDFFLVFLICWLIVVTGFI